MQETNAILQQILEALKTAPTVSQAGTVEGDATREIVGTPRVKKLAEDWLKNNPEHHNKSSRWLEKNVRPMGVRIGKSTWARVQK